MVRKRLLAVNVGNLIAIVIYNDVYSGIIIEKVKIEVARTTFKKLRDFIVF